MSQIPRYHNVLRGDDHRFQFSSASTGAKRRVRDGQDIGGDDHVWMSATRWAAVEYVGGVRKGSRRQVGHRPNKEIQDTHLAIMEVEAIQ